MLSNIKNLDDIAVDSMTFPMTSDRIISEATSACFLLPKMLFHSFELSLSLMFSAAYERTSVEDTSF